MNRKIYYNQRDTRWAKHPYTSTAHPRATIQSGGCGPTSSAALVTSLKDTVIYPDRMGDLFKQNGIRAAEGTDLNKAVRYIAKKYDLEFTQLSSNDDLINYLANGYVALVSVYGGSIFSTGGHIMFLCGYANGMIQVHDSNLYVNKFNTAARRGKVIVQGNDVWIPVENWKAYAKCNLKYVFKIPEDKKPGPKYKIGQVVKVTVPVQIAILGDFCLVDSRGYQFWVYNSLLNKDKTKVECLATIDGYNEAAECYQMVVFKGSIYETKFDCKEEFMTDKF